MLASLVRVLLFYTMPCVIGQAGTATSHPRHMHRYMFPIVAGALQTHLERKRAYRKDV
jgi:hypothetical protein